MKCPEKIEMKGKKNRSLIKILSQFPKNADVTLDREWQQSYRTDRVFTLTYDKNFREITIKEIY